MALWALNSSQKIYAAISGEHSGGVAVVVVDFIVIFVFTFIAFVVVVVVVFRCVLASL